MDAGTSKRAHGQDLRQELDESATKRRRLTPPSDSQPAAPMMAHQVNPSPYAGPAANRNQETQCLEHHQHLSLQWAAPTYGLPEGTVGSAPQLVSVGGHQPPVRTSRLPMINHQMRLIWQRLVEERHHHRLEEIDGIAP
ncbi:hypothetical protein HPB50_012762 [Hyalomma asiaticum]|uniref:Uncharacterized protein n=1 Tax=Hyalomma asiaticum TaxID=266040 RepID=A0ACB7TN96_HYAAI|nr:hypothetical protein HPB50_012762 [Hyalomma asiaticum]